MAVIYQDTTNKYDISTSIWEKQMERSSFAGFIDSIGSFLDPVRNVIEDAFQFTENLVDKKGQRMSNDNKFMLEGDELNLKNNLGIIAIIGVAAVIITVVIFKK